MTVAPPQDRWIPLLERWPGRRSKGEILEVRVAANSPIADKPLLWSGLPKSALVMMIGRGQEFVVPRGATVIQPGDELMVLVDGGDAATVRAMIETPEAGG
jgi:Trk K+ transport system NAD-binding subunit